MQALLYLSPEGTKQPYTKDKSVRRGDTDPLDLFLSNESRNLQMKQYIESRIVSSIKN